MASAPNHMMDAARAPCISSLPVFPHPLSLSFLPPALFSPALYLCLETGCSLTQPPDHCMAASSVFPSWHKHYIHTDIILGKVLFPFLYFAFTQSSPLPCCCLHWHSLLPFPQELSVHCHCKANAWDSLKQTASILCRSPICG